MTKSETIAQCVPQPSNAASEALLWLAVIAVTIAVVTYIVIRANDKIWRKRIQREAVQ